MRRSATSRGLLFAATLAACACFAAAQQPRDRVPTPKSGPRPTPTPAGGLLKRDRDSPLPDVVGRCRLPPGYQVVPVLSVLGCDDCNAC